MFSSLTKRLTEIFFGKELFKSLVTISLIVLAKTVLGNWAHLELASMGSKWTTIFFIFTYSTIIVSVIYFLAHSLNQGDVKIKRLKAEISQREKETNLLKIELESAYIDPLTNLWSRKYFDNEIESHIKRTIRSDKNIAFFAIDANNLKYINDTFGHAAGDQMLMSLSKIIRSIFMRATDLVVRYGGDEFIVVTEYENDAQLEFLAKKTEKALSDFDFEYSGKMHQACASMGYSATVLNKNCCSKMNYKKFIEDSIKQADDQMYENKKSTKLKP